MLVAVGRRHAARRELPVRQPSPQRRGGTSYWQGWSRGPPLPRPAGSLAAALSEARRASGPWALGAVIELARTSR
jgi:hypothetical protein